VSPIIEKSTCVNYSNNSCNCYVLHIIERCDIELLLLFCAKYFFNNWNTDKYRWYHNWSYLRSWHVRAANTTNIAKLTEASARTPIARNREWSPTAAGNSMIVTNVVLCCGLRNGASLMRIVRGALFTPGRFRFRFQYRRAHIRDVLSLMGYRDEGASRLAIVR